MNISKEFLSVFFAAFLLSVPVWADIRSVTPTSREETAWWKARHAEKLAEIQAASTNGGISVVFLGDSITHFWETGAGRSVWARTFGRHSTFRSINLGFSGDRTENLLWRIRNGEMQGYEAKAIVLMIGTNNHEPPMDVICGVKAVVNAAFEKQCSARMLLLPIFPRGKDASDARRQGNALVNRELRKFCDGRKVVWCDFSDQFLAPDGRLSSEVMPDYLHPGAEGYEIWAAAIVPYVNAMVEKYGQSHIFGGRFSDRWNRPVCDGPAETIPQSRVSAANNRWTDGFFGGYWWLSRVEQARDAIAKAGGEMDLVMLGDSITHFWQIRHAEHWQKFVGNRRIANFGCAGDTVQNVLWMVENGALDGCTAKFVSILIGTNNNTSETSDPAKVAEGVKKAVAGVRTKQPNATIVLTAIFPRGGSAKDAKHLAARERNERTNAILKTFAAQEKGVVWLDVNAKFLGPDGFVPKAMMADRIHPTDAGYDVWAAELNRIMAK